MKYRYRVFGMTCASCVSHVERAAMDALKQTDPGKTAGVSVSLLTNSLVVDLDGFDGATLPEVCEAAILRAVRAAGYGLAPETDQAPSDTEKAASAQKKTALRRLCASLVLMLILMAVAMFPMVGVTLPWVFGKSMLASALLQFALTVPVLYLNRRFFFGGFRALFHLAPNMDSLIAIGAGAAFLYGTVAVGVIAYATVTGTAELSHAWAHQMYFESAATIVTLVSLGKYLEGSARDRASLAVRELAGLSPDTAILVSDGQETEVPTASLAVGDTVAVREGLHIPADGTVLSGEGAVDESAITGESIPRAVTAGDTVSTAAVLCAGSITVRVEKTGKDTSLSRMIRLLEDAAASKAPVSRLADRISAIFVPSVICIAVLTFAVWLIFATPTDAFRYAVSVLVISCPCALGLATPAAIMTATGRGAREGIFIKSAEALETLHAATVAVFDKTGTLTEGLPTVTDVVPLGKTEFTPEDILRLAAGAEHGSSHPLASAVLRAADGTPPAEEYRSVPGKSVSATVLYQGKPHQVEVGVPSDETDAVSALRKKGATVSLVRVDGVDTALLGITDTLREGAAEAIRSLSALGIRSVLLTGDHAVTAAAVAETLGITEFRASMRPEDKVHAVTELKQTGTVVMTGDGINDSPALAAADVGIAVGTGTAVAANTADIVISSGDPRAVVRAVRLSKDTVRIVRENLFWALFYNSVGIPLAAGVLVPVFGIGLNPMIASAAMSLSSVSVVLNALRLGRGGKKTSPAPRPTTQETVKTKDTVKNTTKNTKENPAMNETVTLHVEGMMCMHCVSHVQKALESVPGTTGVSVDLASGTAVVTGTADRATLAAAVNAAGYRAS